MANFFADVIQKDLRYNSTARVADPNLLEPTTRRLVEQVIAAAGQMGISLMIFETYRSQARQQELFDNGATRLRAVGVHRFGLACDIVRVVGGEPSWKGDFSFLGQLARSGGLIWGGDWGNPAIKHDFVDAVHVQRCTVARQPSLFAGEWYPEETYNPYAEEPHLLFAAVTQTGPTEVTAAPKRKARAKNRTA
ncbi:MAG: M15 family metallopeptidase [Candidatus Sulfotelmatobacter sp.]